MINYRELQKTFKVINSLDREKAKLNKMIIKRCNEVISCLPTAKQFGTIDEFSFVDFCEYDAILSPNSMWNGYKKELIMIIEKDEYGTEMYYTVPKHFFDIPLAEARKEGKKIEETFEQQELLSKELAEKETYLRLKEKYE